MSSTIYVVDTSYLLELFECEGFCHPKAVIEVRKRFQREASRGARFFVPLPCIFELGNHIADVKHNTKRTKLAQLLLNTVKGSLEKRVPWCITPTGKPEEILPELMDRFVHLAGKRKVGLVDTFTLTEAERLKVRHSGAKSKVHVWTNDSALKDHEPDTEADAFLWKADGSSR